MHIKLIMKKVIEYIYMRRGNFLLTLIVLGISIYLVAFAMQIYSSSEYYIVKAKEIITDESVLNINIIPDLADMDCYEKVGDFDTAMKQKYGDSYGKFMEMETTYNINGEEVLIKTLYIDEAMLDLCGVGSSMTELKGNTSVCFVGSNLKDIYSEGTVFTDIHTENEYTVTGSLPETSEWISTPVFATTDVTTSLDDYIVVLMDDSYFELSVDFYANITNSIFVKYETEAECEQLKSDTRELADESGLMLYMYTFDELVSSEMEENRSLMNSIVVLIIFAVVTAIFSYISAGLADIYSRHYEMAVMYLNKVSRLDMFMILFFENIIKAVIATGLSFLIFMSGLDSSEKVIFISMVMPKIIFSLIAFMLVVTAISNMTVREKKLINLIGGARL